MRRSFVSVLALLALSPLAHAQSLRMEVTGRLEASISDPSSSHFATAEITARIYFRSDSAPIDQFGDETDFAVEWVEADGVLRGHGQSSTFSYSGPPNPGSRVTNNPTDDSPVNGPSFEFIVGIPDAGPEGQGISITLVVAEPNGFPGVAPKTLPGDPLDYRNSGAYATLFTLVPSPGSFGASSVWDPKDSAFNHGGFSFRVAQGDPPTPKTESCSEADLAQPFGVLNFDDVLAYLTAFGAGCP